MAVGRVLGVILLSAICVSALERESRLVHTAQGPVRGYKEPDLDLFSFYGIPYATVPTGPLRFKAPFPAPVWLDTLEAISQDIVCPQARMIPINKTMQEDCLIVNIHVPDTEQKNLPVVVYVHGGAYQIGFGELLSPKNLVNTKKLIAVTFNYRLGVHGFLCLGTKDAPGNAGIKDQVALLRWVQKNIASFGGNPKEVTIAGYSAGSSAVDLLMISKSTKGLFNKVIPESGANVGVWSVQLEPLQIAKNYAQQLGFDNVDDIYALEEFYKTASFDLLASNAFMDLKNSTFNFVPCVEQDTGVEKFLDDYPENILKTGDYPKLPMLYGFANMEGLFRIQFGSTDWMKLMNDNFGDFLPADLQFESKEQKAEVAQKIKQFYFGEKLVSEETILEYIDYFTDIIFAYPTLRSVQLQLQAGNDQVYLYEFSYPHEFVLPSGQKIIGSNHCSQSGAVLDGSGMNIGGAISEKPEYNKTREVTRNLWINFITNGSPVPPQSDLLSWPAARCVVSECGPHMSISTELHMRVALLPKRTRFWDNIYHQYYRAPVSPPLPPSKHAEL